MKNRIEIDSESAEYVRLMFLLAANGNNLSKIAIILNAQGIPTPSEYKKKHGVFGGWKTADPDYTFWNNTLVGRILHDIRHTFAVHTLEHMAAQGMDTYCAIPYIMTYMGHRTIKCTEKYLRHMRGLSTP